VVTCGRAAGEGIIEVMPIEVKSAAIEFTAKPKLLALASLAVGCLSWEAFMVPKTMVDLRHYQITGDGIRVGEPVREGRGQGVDQTRGAALGGHGDRRERERHGARVRRCRGDRLRAPVRPRRRRDG